MWVLLLVFFSRFQMGFYFVTTGWIFEIGLCENSIILYLKPLNNFQDIIGWKYEVYGLTPAITPWINSV